MVHSPAAMFPPSSGPTQKSVALQTGESISDNSQTVYSTVEDDTCAMKNSLAEPSNANNNENTVATNTTTSAAQLPFQDAVSGMGDSIADISFSFASQQHQQQRSMFLSNHYGPDRLLHGASDARVPRSASFHTGDQLKIDSPPPMLRIPRSQAFYPGVYFWSHGRDMETQGFSSSHPA